MTNVFEFKGYKEFLKFQISANKLVKAYQSQMSQAMGCQKSFLSQVLHNENMHLTQDHAANLSHFWGLTEEETNYFVDLVSIERAGTSALKSLLKVRMNKQKVTRESFTERFKWPQLERSDAEEVYYSSWYWAAIHIIVSIEKYNQAEPIAKHLNLPIHLVRAVLDRLEEFNLLKKTEAGWTVAQNHVYLPKTSKMVEMHHFNWRQRALNNIQLQDSNSSHYSSIFALSSEDFHKLKEHIVSYIESMNQMIAPSSAEELVCFTCDLFKV